MRKEYAAHGAEPLWKQILRFALPIAATSMLQQMFNAADMAIVGQFAKDNTALAAVSSTSAVVTLFITMFSGFAIGANVVVARLVGAQSEDELPKAVQTSLVTALLLGIVFTALGEMITYPLLEIMETPENIIAQAQLYLRIYLLGSTFQLLYNFEAAILRANGDTRRPLICLIISGVVNVVLNVLFVVACGMDVAGVAIATVISGGVSTFLLLYDLTKASTSVRMLWSRFCLDGRMAKDLLRIGIPAAIQGILFNTANMIIQSGINVFGDIAISGSSIGVNAEAFVYYLLGGFSQASVTFSGQNFGAGRLSQCWTSTRYCLLLGGVLTELFAVLLILFRGGFAGLFTPNPVIAEYAALRMECVLLFEIFNLTIEVVSGALRGLGYSATPTALVAVFVCGIRVLWVLFVFPDHATFQMLMAVYPISWTVTAIAVTAAYLLVKKRLQAKEVPRGS